MHDLYRQHSAFVFSLCMAALRHRQDAEDATQQVFTRAWRSRDTYDVTQPTGAWLTGITRRVIADVFARRERDHQAAEAGADAAGAQRFAAAHRRRGRPGGGPTEPESAGTTAG